jgi:hypothetical protein
MIAVKEIVTGELWSYPGLTVTEAECTAYSWTFAGTGPNEFYIVVQVAEPPDFWDDPYDAEIAAAQEAERHDLA